MNILKIKVDEESLNEFYQNHSTFHDGDSGLDIFIPEDIEIPAQQTYFINHKIRCEMVQRMISNATVFHSIRYSDINLSYLLLPRSSISKTPLIMQNSIGLIDAGYRGNIIAAVYNTSNKNYLIQKGARLFQLVATNFGDISLQLVDELSETTRGDGGIGSTGK